MKRFGHHDILISWLSLPGSCGSRLLCDIFFQQDESLAGFFFPPFPQDGS